MLIERQSILGVVKRIVRRLKSCLYLIANRLTVQLLKFLFSLFRPRIVRFKVVPGLDDGTGAQLHKQGSVYCLSRMLHSSFSSSPLLSIEIQHGDVFTSDQEIRQHIDWINRALSKTDSTDFPKHSKEVLLQGVPRLDIQRILPALVSSLLLNKPTTFCLNQAFGYLNRSDRCFYLQFGEIFSEGLNFQQSLNQEIISIQLHLRMSTVNPISDRYLPENYYLKFLNEITAKLNTEGKNYKIIIHTDFNDSLVSGLDIRWSATPETTEYWKTIGVTDVTGKLNLHTIQLAKHILDSISIDFANVEIWQETTPIDAWKEMAKADYLQISNSSFSFLGAIMNTRAKIYSPKNKRLSMPGWNVI